jgi:hypothetical protein
VLVCRPGRPWALAPPAPASPVLGSQKCTTMPNLFLVFETRSYCVAQVAWNFLHSLGWAWTWDPPASESHVLGSQAFTTTPAIWELSRMQILSLLQTYWTSNCRRRVQKQVVTSPPWNSEAGSRLSYSMALIMWFPISTPLLGIQSLRWSAYNLLLSFSSTLQVLMAFLKHFLAFCLSPTLLLQSFRERHFPKIPLWRFPGAL